jgi:hypothetical protein
MQLSDLEDIHGFHSRRAVAVQIDDTPRQRRGTVGTWLPSGKHTKSYGKSPFLMG